DDYADSQPAPCTSAGGFQPLSPRALGRETLQAANWQISSLRRSVLVVTRCYTKIHGSVWESNPQTAFFKPPTGFEDQGPHQRYKHSPAAPSGPRKLYSKTCSAMCQATRLLVGLGGEICHNPPRAAHAAAGRVA